MNCSNGRPGTPASTFGNAARNALNKITEKIVDLVSNKLLDQLFEGLGSAIGLGGGNSALLAGGGSTVLTNDASDFAEIERVLEQNRARTS